MTLKEEKERAVSVGRLWVVWSITLVVAATLLRLQFLQGLGTNAPYITFYPAVAIAALYGGLRAGFLTLALSAAVAIYFWVEPVHTLTVRGSLDWLLLVTFLATTVLISLVSEAMHRARARAHAAIEREVEALAQREADERLRFALEQSQTGGWDLDLADHTAFRTLRHDQIFGYESLLPDWTYERFLEHVLPEDRAEVDRRFRAATATQSDWSFECRIRRKDGAVRWIWATGGHQRDATGQARRMAGIVQDITERRRVEEALRESEEMFRESFYRASVGKAQVEPVDFRFVRVNPAFCAFTGYTEAELLGKTFPDITFPEDRADNLALAARLFEGKTPTFVREKRYVRKDGAVVWAHVSATVIFDSAGRPKLTSAVIQDITAHKQAEEEIRTLNAELEQRVEERTRQLAEANKELEAFNQAMVGREQRIIEMKEEVNALCRELGREPIYPPVWEPKKVEP